MTPADELRTAATKIRTTCDAASPGPWTIAKVPPFTMPLLMSRYEETPDDEDVLIVGNIDVEPEDQAVVQMLHPGVGAALADWLDTAAEYADKWPPDHQANSPFRQGALAVARAVLGSSDG
ncbi:hypothetical protein AB0E25_33300 [Streptomyces bobili]|uniref:hypothetical protein n=1 Tax=Streptomyces bobili TaxID=67280 RepID=UPI0033CF1263